MNNLVVLFSQGKIYIFSIYIKAQFASSYIRVVIYVCRQILYIVDGIIYFGSDCAALYILGQTVCGSIIMGTNSHWWVHLTASPKIRTNGNSTSHERSIPKIRTNRNSISHERSIIYLYNITQYYDK